MHQVETDHKELNKDVVSPTFKISRVDQRQSQQTENALDHKSFQGSEIKLKQPAIVSQITIPSQKRVADGDQDSTNDSGVFDFNPTPEENRAVRQKVTKDIEKPDYFHSKQYTEKEKRKKKRSKSKS